jgi:hypothetical protein
MPYYEANNVTTHYHHIVPKHVGGTDDTNNMVELTVENHAEEHRKLFEQHGRWQDELAWKVLSGQVGCEQAIREAARRTHLGNKYNLGRRHTPETKAKISEANKNRIVSDETRIQLSKVLSGAGNPNYGRLLSDWKKREKDMTNGFYGKQHSPEVLQQIGAKQLGVKNHNYGKRNPRVSCVVCRMEVAVNTFPFHRAKHE